MRSSILTSSLRIEERFKILKENEMRCKQEEFVKGEYFHIYNRAVNKELLFHEEEDYEYFLERFEKNLNKIPSSIIAYCLMPNHFHFFLRQDEDIPVFKLFDSSFRPYVMHFNAKYKRKGTLFQGPLQHIHVKSNKYFIQLCNYIHVNPLKAGLVNDLTDWKFSNYNGWIGEENSRLFFPEFKEIFRDELENYKQTIREYEKYIEEKEFNELLFD
jgi:putative transposase